MKKEQQKENRIDEIYTKYHIAESQIINFDDMAEQYLDTHDDAIESMFISTLKTQYDVPSEIALELWNLLTADITYKDAQDMWMANKNYE